MEAGRSIRTTQGASVVRSPCAICGPGGLCSCREWHAHSESDRIAKASKVSGDFRCLNRNIDTAHRPVLMLTPSADNTENFRKKPYCRFPCLQECSDQRAVYA